MLKSLFRRRAPTDPRARPNAPASHPLDGPIRALHRADGTQSEAQFQQQTLPLFQALHLAAQQRDPSTADQALTTLLMSIAQACRRAGNHRLPKGQQVTDYRRFETLYNYALISAMAIAWHMDAAELEQGGQQALAETLIPPTGLARLRQEALVWEHSQAFFEGRDDGGLREVAGRSALPGRVPETHASASSPNPGRSAIPQRQTEPSPEATADKFLTPNSSQWANPLSKGWALVEAIREGLRDGSLPYNRKQAWVQVDREGRTFLQVPEVFEWCYERLDAEVPPKTLVNQFGRLNICTRTRKGQNLLRGGRRNQKAYQQGFVVEDPSLFWDGEPPADQFYIRHLTRHGFGQSPPSPPDAAA